MWVLFGLASAFMNSSSDVLLKLATKESNGSKIDPLLASCAMHGSMAVLSLPFAALLGGEPDLSFTGLLPVLICSLFGAVSSSLYMHAMREAPLSLTAPLMALTPAFMLLTGPIITGQQVSLLGGIGVGICIIGLYVVNLQPGCTWYEPLLIWHKPGQMSMFLATALFSITAPLDQLGLEAQGLWWYLPLVTGFLSLMLGPFALLRAGSHGRPNLRLFIGSGILANFSALSQYAGMALAPVTYVICLKRLSTVIGPIMGRRFLGEAVPPSRAAGSLILFAGALVMALTALSE